MGSMFSPDVQETTTKNEMPAWMDQYGEWITGGAQDMANREYTPYEGDRVAGFNPMQENAFGSMNQWGEMAPAALGGGYNALSDITGAGMMGGAAGSMGDIMGRYGSMADSLLGRDPSNINASTGRFSSAGQAQQADLMNRGDVRNVDGGSFLGMDRDAYTNQYTDSVVNDAMSDINRNWLGQEQQIGSAANAAGAFGGSRHGVQSALSAGEANRNAGQLSNQLRSQAFDAASGLMGQDLNRGLQADLSNQGMDWNVGNLNTNVGLQNAQMGNTQNMFNAGQSNAMSQFNAGQRNNMAQFNQGVDQQNMSNALGALGGMGTMAGGIGNLGQGIANFTQQQGQNLTNFGASGIESQLGAGGAYQNQEQQQLNDLYNRFVEARDWGSNNFAQFAGMGQGTQGSSTQTGQEFGPSKASQVAGLGMAAGSMIPSDRRLKRNIKKIGNINGNNWYSYDYIWGESSVGVMADEVPWAAVDGPGGFKMVDYSKV